MATTPHTRELTTSGEAEHQPTRPGGQRSCESD